MRIRTLALLTSFAAFACGGDDDGETTNNTTTGPTTTVTSAESGSESSTAGTTLTTDASSESSTAGTTMTTDATESSGSESESSGTPDTGSSSGGASAECEAYCDLFQTNCDGGVGGSMSYADDDACLEACAGFSEAGLMCRTGHLDGSATGMDPTMVKGYYDTHCSHGDSSGGGVCMD
ncbi:MAG TPA: hypothetical protein VG755_35450 [Nannocystaceae bacterium]|nr:hypothetical protein [Nannocystaceae bacterium]